MDGKWLHWNHPILPHWQASENLKYPLIGTSFDPDIDEIGANFYPSIGPYSSSSFDVIRLHMKQMKEAGSSVIIISWYPPGTADDAGEPSDRLLPTLLTVADEYGLKVALHIEPYKGRSPDTLKRDLAYILETYGSHNAFYRHGKDNLPLYYLYDSYNVSPNDWSRLLSIHGDISIRDTPLDGYFLGLFVEHNHCEDCKCGPLFPLLSSPPPNNDASPITLPLVINTKAFATLCHLSLLTSLYSPLVTLVKQGKWDGFYTYFAADRFTYGSTRDNWEALAQCAKEMRPADRDSRNGILNISVGPGYIDTRIRPWNHVNTRDRGNGRYYDDSWRMSLAAKPDIVSITSFNEWHEGTQIEPAKPRSTASFRYADYGGLEEDYYLRATRRWSDSFHGYS